MAEHAVHAATAIGLSIWYDSIDRQLTRSGELARMIRDDGLGGLTSNPSIFEKAITGSTDYDADIAAGHAEGLSSEDIFRRLAIADIGAAADLFLPLYHATDGRDGYVSLEVSPQLAHDSAGTLSAGMALFEAVGRPNVMIKVPATRAGLPAIEGLIDAGINVNATLLFSVTRYREVIDAYLLGLEKRLRRGQPIHSVASVASLFVSRVDTAVDALLDKHADAAAMSLKGRIAVANAQLAFAEYRLQFAGQRFAALHAAGAGPQRLLWASTGTKNPKYSDLLYVESLVAQDTINTVPPKTYKALIDHGRIEANLDGTAETAATTLARLASLGIDLDTVTSELEAQGVDAFAQAYANVLAAIERKRMTVRRQQTPVTS